MLTTSTEPRSRPCQISRCLTLRFASTLNRDHPDFLDAGLAIPHDRRWPTALHPAKRIQSPVNPRPDGNSGPPRSWNRSLCARRCWLLSDSTKALMLSQYGPLASAPLTALPTSKATRLDAQPFRIFLCRRLHPLPLSMRTCRCGHQLDMFGHHRAACAVAGGLGEGAFLWRWLPSMP